MKKHTSYSDLEVIERTGFQHAWSYFGEGDQLGTLNFITPECVIAATAEVTLGEVICLSTRLDAITPPLNSDRPPFAHRIVRDRGGSDDSLDGFYLQGASQWDGLAHVRYREFGFYGGRQEDALEQGELGMQIIAKMGVVGRGILIDVERYMRLSGCEYQPCSRVPITPALLDEVVAAQGSRVNPGDIVLLRTGWLAWYKALTDERRAGLVGTLHNGPGGLECAGLDGSVDSAAWLWDHQVSAVAADNPALEVLPVNPQIGFLHRRLIPLLGMPIGEFWELDTISEACSRHDRWSFLLTSAPLNLYRGVGSPNNAYAVL